MPALLASIAWIAFGLSCLWWEDVGDWSRTHSLGIAAFVIAAIALFGTVGADYLGSAGRALRQRAPWLDCARRFPDLVGGRDRQICLAAAAVLSAAAIDSNTRLNEYSQNSNRVLLSASTSSSRRSRS